VVEPSQPRCRPGDEQAVAGPQAVAPLGENGWVVVLRADRDHGQVERADGHSVQGAAGLDSGGTERLVGRPQQRGELAVRAVVDRQRHQPVAFRRVDLRRVRRVDGDGHHVVGHAAEFARQHAAHRLRLPDLHDVARTRRERRVGPHCDGVGRRGKRRADAGCAAPDREVGHFVAVELRVDRLDAIVAPEAGFQALAQLLGRQRPREDKGRPRERLLRSLGDRVVADRIVDVGRQPNAGDLTDCLCKLTDLPVDVLGGRPEDHLGTESVADAPTDSRAADSGDDACHAEQADLCFGRLDSLSNHRVEHRRRPEIDDDRPEADEHREPRRHPLVGLLAVDDGRAGSEQRRECRQPQKLCRDAGSVSDRRDDQRTRNHHGCSPPGRHSPGGACR